MARSRRGSFGLQPRVAPDVTGTIVALAREYVAKRDSLIMDAWRNGGTFDGKKATDDAVLAYWNERSKGLDKGDPDYEAAKNQVMQLQYAVAQSKADVLHAQGKMSDNTYAQFFLKWAQKVPANSEFYRTLQKDAAQLIESAKSKAAAGAERARTEAFNAFVTKTTDQHIAIGDAMTKALTDLSKTTGLSITGNGDELLTLLTQNVKANPNEYRLLLDTIKKGDPHFDGNLTEGYFAQHIKDATQGYSLIADRAQKAGFVSAYASAAQGMAGMSQWGQNLRVWPVSETYSTAENAWQSIMQDPNASQMDKLHASGAFSTAISKMVATPGIDAGSKKMLEADAARLLGQDGGDAPSFGTSMLGRPGVDPKTTMTLGAWHAMAAEMAANPTAWAYSPVDANGQFDPTGRGPLGMVPAGAVQPGAQGVMVPGTDGKAVLAMVMPHSVYTTDPNNPSASPKLAGYQIAYNVGGKTVSMWGYRDNRGGNHWSLVSPLADGATSQVDNKGDVYVTPHSTAATDPIARAAELDAKLGTHMADQLRAQQAVGALGGGVRVSNNQLDAKGHIIGTVELQYSNGTFTATTTSNTLDKEGHVLSSQSTPLSIAVSSADQAAFSASRLAAGDLPGTTFSSPLAASVMAAQQTQTQDQVGKFAADPAFQQAFLSQTMTTLGIQNPYDPRLADAWRSVTASPKEWFDNADARAAAQRNDLQYPGAAINGNRDAYNKQVEVNFGGQKLTIPALPSYLQNAQINIGGGGTSAGSANPWSNLLPGLGAPPQMATGSPAPSVTPTPTPTPTPTNITPTPTPPPAALTPAPTPAPPPPPSIYASSPPGYHGK